MHEPRTLIRLTDCQAYIFISIPTGTSTIFGAFQVILISLANEYRSSQSYGLVSVNASIKLLRCDCSAANLGHPKDQVNVGF